LHIGVTGAEHRGKPGCLLFAPAFLARLFEMPMSAHNFQGAFAVDFLFQSPQRLVYWLAFFKLYFGQNTITSSPQTSAAPGQHRRRSSLSGRKGYFASTLCQLEMGSRPG